MLLLNPIRNHFKTFDTKRTAFKFCKFDFQCFRNSQNIPWNFKAVKFSRNFSQKFSVLLCDCMPHITKTGQSYPRYGFSPVKGRKIQMDLNVSQT